MTKVVLTYSPDSPYDDVPERRYHFPEKYLSRARSAEGDWILYYEKDSKGRRSKFAQTYFAMARIASITPDPQRGDRHYANVAEYLEFPNPVPVKLGGRYIGGAAPGGFQNAVRRITDAEFAEVVSLGMVHVIGDRRDAPGLVPPIGLHEDPAEFHGAPRDIVQQISNRRVRDAAFARQIVDVAYQGRCAVTGLRIVNGLGRAEVEAAHIRPVAADGPDSPRNGIALSRTVHWMFDRGLLSLEDGGTILVAKDKVPDEALRLINPDRRIIEPSDVRFRPHPHFLRYHREHVFKG